jgi:hypothetical protein
MSLQPLPTLLCRRWLGGFVLLAAGLGAAEAPPSPVVELPKFEVTDSRVLPQPESWRYGEIQGFEILSNASDKATQRLIKDFNMFREALTAVWPIPNRAGVPTSLILCGQGNKFDAFKKKDGGSYLVTASLFLKNKEQTAIIIDLQATTLNVLAVDTANDAATGTDSSLIEVDHVKALYREYVHFLLGRSEPRLPAWLEEGMAQIIMAMKVDPTSIVFGKLEESNTISVAQANVLANNALPGADELPPMPGAPAEDRDFNVALQRHALVPFGQFFAVTAESPEALNPLGNNVWAKQSYAFVHMCLYGRNKKYQKPFAQFLARLGKEPVSEYLFQECFKVNYKQMAVELRGYIQMADYQHQEYNLKKGSTALGGGPALLLRDATESEVGRIKGEAIVLAGFPEKAKIELTAPYIRGERNDAQLLAAVGIFERANGEEARGVKFIEAAVAKKVVRPRAYVELARARYEAAVAKPGAGDRLSAEQVMGVTSLLLTARSQPPPTVETYELWTEIWTHSAAAPKKEDVGYLIEGVRSFPNRLRMMYLTAQLCVQADMVEAAHSLTDYGLKVSPDAKTRANFEKLKVSLPPDPGPAVKDAKAGTPPVKK